MEKTTKFKKRKEVADSFYRQKNFLNAQEIYKEAINIDPENKKMLFIINQNLAATNFYLRNYADSSKYATDALKHNPIYTKALVIRAKCYSELEDFEKCIIDCKLILTLSENEEIQILLRNSSNQLLFNGPIIRAKQNYKENRFNDCINECENILRFEEISEIREILEDAKILKIGQSMSAAQLLYEIGDYEICINDCDTILNDQDLVEANLLKSKAEVQITNHKNINEILIKLHQNYENKMYKECLDDCTIILCKLETVEIKRNEYENKVGSIIIKIRELIDDRTMMATNNYESGNFEQCIQDCKYILEIKEIAEIRCLMENSILKDIEEKVLRTQNFFFDQNFKECFKECNYILNIMEYPAISEILEVIEHNIQSKMYIAKNLFEMKLFAECITNCEYILNIDAASLEAQNLLKIATIDETIQNGLILVNNLFQLKKFTDCKKECIRLYKIKEVAGITEFIKNCEAAIKEEVKKRKLIDEIMRHANENLKNANFEDCIEDCLKVLNIESSIEANSLMKKAKSEREQETQNFIRNTTIRAKAHFEKAEYEKCVEKCSSILSIDDQVVEAKDMLGKSTNALDYEKQTVFEDILKVEYGANRATITKAYYLLSKEYHPDKHTNSTKEMQDYCHKMFQKIAHAHRILSTD